MGGRARQRIAPFAVLAALLWCTAGGSALMDAGQASAASSAATSGKALSELTSGSPETETATKTTATTTRSSESTGTSRTLILAAIGAAVVLLSGIGYVIARDARRVAPAGDADIAEGRSGRDAAAQLRKRRAKAKAARRQRKRTR